MLRKIYVGIMVSVIASSSWANNFYIGAGLGPDMATFTDNANVKEVSGVHTGFNVRNREQLSGVGVFGSLFAGYGMTFNNLKSFSPQLAYYLALEVNGNISSLEHKNSNDEYVHNTFSHTKFTMQSNYGISVLPGLLFTENTLFFARLGYDNARFKISTSDISLENINKNLNGFRWGVGMKRFVTQQIAVGMEYSQSIYDGTRSSTLDALSNVTKIANITPRRNQVEFSLQYQFC